MLRIASALDECGLCVSARAYIVLITQSFQQPPAQLSVTTSCTRDPDRRGRAQAQVFLGFSSYCHERRHDGWDLVTAAGQVSSTNGAIGLLMLPLLSTAASLASLASQDPRQAGAHQLPCRCLEHIQFRLSSCFNTLPPPPCQNPTIRTCSLKVCCFFATSFQTSVTCLRCYRFFLSFCLLLKTHFCGKEE